MHVLHVRAAGRRPRELVEELVDVGEEQQVGIEVDDLVILVQTKDVQLGKGGVEPRPVLQLAFISVFYVPLFPLFLFCPVRSSHNKYLLNNCYMTIGTIPLHLKDKGLLLEGMPLLFLQ